MERQRIDNFTREYCGTVTPCSLPCSFVCDEAGTILAAKIKTDRAILERRYVYLAVPRVVGEAELYIDDKLVGKTAPSGSDVFLDVKPYISLDECEFKIKFISGGEAAVLAPIELLSFNGAAIDSVHVAERHEGGSVTIDLKLRTLGSPDGVKAIATLISPAGQIYYGGITRGYGSITVRDPLYWWPLGLGVQNLYRLTVNLYGESDVEDTVEMRVGLRSPSVLREDGCRRLAFGGIPFTPMGAAYLPPSAELLIKDSKILSHELSSIARGGFNAIFLDSSVKYIPDALPELCDDFGIVILREAGEEAEALSRELARLAAHPSLSYLCIPESELSDVLYGICREAAPDVGIILGGEYAGSLIQAPPSLPERETLLAIGGEREVNPLSTTILSHGGRAYCDLLLRAADGYLYPKSAEELGYLTRLLQAYEVKEKIESARISDGAAGVPFAIFSELCDRHPTVSAAAVDAFGRRKTLYHRAVHAFSRVSAVARIADGRVLITVINDRRQELLGFVYYRIIDSKNMLVYNGAEEIQLSPVSRTSVSVDLREVIAGRESECYLEYGVSGSNAQYSDTALFVKAKDFRFEKPTVGVKIDGAGEDFSLTLTSDAYMRGVEVSFGATDTELSDSGFDITSPAPVKLSVKVQGGKITKEQLEERLVINCLNTLGIVN